MLESDYPTYLLMVQFRTVSGVNAFPNKKDYRGKLVGAPSAAVPSFLSMISRYHTIRRCFGGQVRAKKVITSKATGVLFVTVASQPPPQ